MSQSNPIDRILYSSDAGFFISFEFRLHLFHEDCCEVSLQVSESFTFVIEATVKIPDRHRLFFHIIS
jgi:hypothetical protein